MICAIVLAAGRSRRMGTQKLLLPLGGMPVIARVVDAALHGPVERVFVVVGGDAGPIQTALGGRAVQFVRNPEPESEMLDSLRCGVRVLPADCAAAVVVLGDQPGLQAEGIARLVQAFRASNHGLVLPSHGGKPGHPLLFSAKYRDEILTRYDAIGLRGLLQAHPEDVFEVAAPEVEILEDMDFPEDYQRAVAKFARDSAST